MTAETYQPDLPRKRRKEETEDGRRARLAWTVRTLLPDGQKKELKYWNAGSVHILTEIPLHHHVWAIWALCFRWHSYIQLKFAQHIHAYLTDDKNRRAHANNTAGYNHNISTLTIFEAHISQHYHRDRHLVVQRQHCEEINCIITLKR